MTQNNTENRTGSADNRTHMHRSGSTTSEKSAFQQTSSAAC
jgi:hypothetical protein